MLLLTDSYMLDARIQQLPDYHREIYIRLGILADTDGYIRVKDPEALVRRVYPEFDYPEEMVLDAVDNLKRVHLLYQHHDKKADMEVFRHVLPLDYHHDDIKWPDEEDAEEENHA